MNWTNEPATESRPDPSGHEPGQPRLEGEASRLIMAAEKESSEPAAGKAHAKPALVTQAALPRPEQQEQHFQVEVDKRGQVHVVCLRGKEAVAAIGLNVAGFNSLVGQGLMRKPHTLQVGGLRTIG